MMIFLMIVSLVFWLIGLVMGALVMVLVEFWTAGRAEKVNGRDQMLELMMAEGIDSTVALKIVNEGLEVWTRWRARMRPLLWNLALDWPEYTQTLKQEYLMYYGRSLPEHAPQSEQSGEPDDDSPEAHLGEWAMGNAPTAIPSESE